MSINKNYVACGSVFRCIRDAVKANVFLYLGYKRHGAHRHEQFLCVNKTTGKCAITYGEWWYGPYNFDDLTIEIKENHETIYKAKGFTPAIVGGLLFGGAGAIAGSLMSTKSPKIKTSYTIAISTKDLNYPGVVVENSDKQDIHNVVTSLEILKKNTTVTNSDNAYNKSFADNDNISKTVLSNETTEELINLKKLYDAGVIDKDTYETKKKKFIDML